VVVVVAVVVVSSSLLSSVCAIDNVDSRSRYGAFKFGICCDVNVFPSNGCRSFLVLDVVEPDGLRSLLLLLRGDDEFRLLTAFGPLVLLLLLLLGLDDKWSIDIDDDDDVVVLVDGMITNALHNKK
jgi:hypothetical protein